MAEPSELKTDRLLLRAWSAGDVDDFLAYSKDDEMARFIPGVPKPYARRDAEQYVAKRILRSWETHPSFAMALDSTVVGGIGLSIDVANEVAELHYGIGRAHWGKGLTTEAARAIVAFGFENYGLEKIFAVADLRNRRSWRVMEKVGMTREGILRSHTNVRDGRSDDVHYGILREEWEASRE